MKRLLILTIGLLVVIGVSQNAYAYVNVGFELGDFTGWTATIPSGALADVVTGWSGYSAVEGNYFAWLKTDGPGSYTTLTRSFYMPAGLLVEGWAAFKTDDYVGYNDNASVRIFFDSSSVPAATPWYRDVAAVGNYGSTSWEYWSWTVPTTGNYTVELRVANSVDSGYDSYALFDANEVIPEPATMSLLSMSLLGLIGFRKKFRR